MKIVGWTVLEDCFDGAFIREVVFNAAVTREFIHHLANGGELEYIPLSSKPFYRVDVSGRFTIMGAEGNCTARVVLSRKDVGAAMRHLKSAVAAFKE